VRHDRRDAIQDKTHGRPAQALQPLHRRRPL